MKNPFPYSDSNKRYHTYTCFLSVSYTHLTLPTNSRV